MVALHNFSSWCLVIVEWLFLSVPLVCPWFVIVVFSDHTHLLFLIIQKLQSFAMNITNQLGLVYLTSIKL